MPHYPSLSADAALEALFRAHPTGVAPLMALHDAVMRNEGPVSKAEREFLAAYVSGLNACRFCFAAHRVMAKAFGIDPDVVDAALDDPTDARIPLRLRALLPYVKTLTLAPATLRPRDVDAVLDQGLDEATLHAAVLVTALYSFMNRIADASGVEPKPAFAEPSEEDLKARAAGDYQSWAQRAGLIPSPIVSGPK